MMRRHSEGEEEENANKELEEMERRLAERKASYKRKFGISWVSSVQKQKAIRQSYGAAGLQIKQTWNYYWNAKFQAIFDRPSSEHRFVQV
ncbi:MAG: hypothetical protein ACPGSB_10055, partial [Opitutales bacterium]